MSHDSHAEGEPHGHIVVPVQVYVKNAIALAILMLLTVWCAFQDWGFMNPVVAMTIAVIKAMLIILFFMNVKYSSKLTWVFVGGAFFWLFILLGMFLPDYIARDFVHQPKNWDSSPYTANIAPLYQPMHNPEGAHGDEHTSAPSH